MMDGDDFLSEDVSNDVQRYEKMLRNKTTEYFDTETLEGIIDYYIQTNKLKKAFAAVTYALNLYQSNSEFLLQKAEIYILGERYENALEELETVESYEPFNTDLHLLKGETLINLRQFNEAAICFDKALQYTDERLDMLFEIAYVYEDCDMYAKAVEYFKILIEEFPEIEQSYYEIGHCFNQLGDYENAIFYYKQLIDNEPYSTTGWYNLGIIYYKTNRFEEALDAYEFCLAIDEEFTAAKFNKANVLVELERYDEAIAEYRSAISEDGADAITYCNLGGCYERMNKNEEARANYKKATDLNPNIAEAWFGIGLTFEKENKNKEALPFYQRACMLEQDNPEYLLVLGETQYRLNQIENCEETYAKLVELDATMMEAWLDWSFVKFTQGKTTEAIEMIMEALKINYDCHQYHYRLVCYLYENGQIQEAKKHLEIGLLLKFDDYFLIYEILPKLQQAASLTEIIESYRNH
jgi:tetratricopeptide (TPR) repeat protein